MRRGEWRRGAEAKEEIEKWDASERCGGRGGSRHSFPLLGSFLLSTLCGEEHPYSITYGGDTHPYLQEDYDTKKPLVTVRRQNWMTLFIAWEKKSKRTET